MSEPTGFTEFHPKWYRSPISTYWWIEKWAYFKFILRELSSLFVASFVVTNLLAISALARGPAAWRAFLDWSRGPLVILLQAVGFLFLLFHTVTWFHLAPRAMALHVAGRRVPDRLVVASNYAAWMAASATLAWFLLGGRP